MMIIILPLQDQYDHFNKIQDAINAVAENGTVYVFNGTYHKNVVIDKTINLIGENRDTTIIDGRENGNVVEITANGVSIEGFTIRNGGELPNASIEISSSNNTIRNCNISNNGYGIYLDSSYNNTIYNCNLREGGVILGGNALSHFLHNIYNNTVNGKPLLYYKNHNNVTLDGVEAGEIILANCSNFEIKNVEISNTTAGIEIAYSNEIEVSHSNTSNTYAGIVIGNSSDNIISNCYFSNNEYGIIIGRNATENFVFNNKFINNKYGFYLFKALNNHILNNAIQDNFVGILLEFSNGIVINNTFIHNGIVMHRSDFNTIVGNTVNGKSLIYLENVSNIAIDKEKGGQIILVNCDNITIQNQNISDTDAGIQLYNAKNISIRNCTISNNLLGIWAYYDCRSIEIHYNNIFGNEWGIDGGIVNATYNYWGSASGPYNEMLNPNGTGDNVSGNVIFKPWLTAPVKGAREEKIKQGENEINAIDEAHAFIQINSTKNNTARIISYEKPPVKEPHEIEVVGKYVEIEVKNESVVKWPIFIQIYYTQQDLNKAGISENKLLGIYFYNESNGKWELYNDTGVNTTNVVINGKEYEGYAYAYAWHLTNVTIGADATPPEIKNVKAFPQNQKLNGYVNITCNATDNIAVSSVFINITYPDGIHHNFSMKHVDATNTYYYNAIYSLKGNYTYFIWANDTTGNSNVSAQKSFSIFVEQYKLTTSVSPSNAGYITLNPSGGIYSAGTVVMATAHANSGYTFDHWEGDASGTNPTITITMNRNKTIIAYFVSVNPPPPSPPPNKRPTVEITHPSNGSVVNKTITIRGKASDDKNVVKVEIRIDNGAWIQVTGTTSWSYDLDTTLLNNGIHKIEARSYDGSLYSNISSISINVFNNHKPVVVITFPDDNAIVKGKITIEGKASDEDGNETLQKVEVRIDNKTWSIANGTTSWSYNIDTTKLSNGMHIINARTYDGHDYSSIASIHINVNNKKKTPGFELIAMIIAIISIALIRRKHSS